MNFDPYNVLNLTRNCTDDEIKTAFKVASLKYHPDRPNGGNAEKFDECTKAKELLLNREKRHIYNRGGWEAVNHYSSSLNSSNVRKCPNYNISLDVSLKDVYNEKTINIVKTLPNDKEFKLDLKLNSKMIGQNICVQNQGLTDEDAVTGDVIIRLNLTPCDFKVNNNDLIMDVSISYLELLEFTITIDHPSGEKFYIKSMFKNPDENGNMVLYYPGLGMSSKGYMIVCISPDLDISKSQISEEDISKIKEIMKPYLKLPETDKRKDITHSHSAHAPVPVRQNQFQHHIQNQGQTQQIPCNVQ